MSRLDTTPNEEQGMHLSSYVVGFGLSVLLTLLAFGLVTQHLLAGNAALLAIGGLAILQFAVQVLCFLHLAGELKPRLKLMVFGFMLMVVLILVGGSIWIMNNLSYNMQAPAQQLKYLHQNEGI